MAGCKVNISNSGRAGLCQVIHQLEPSNMIKSIRFSSSKILRKDISFDTEFSIVSLSLVCQKLCHLVLLSCTKPNRGSLFRARLLPFHVEFLIFCQREIENHFSSTVVGHNFNLSHQFLFNRRSNFILSVMRPNLVLEKTSNITIEFLRVAERRR